MSSTNKTPYYELPQFIGTDIPTWLGDFNGAMLAIDTALKSNADRADTAATSAGQAVNTANSAADAVSALGTTVTGQGTRLTNVEQTNATQSSQISTLNTSVSGLNTRVTALEQSAGGGGHSYYVTAVDIGHYSGTDFNNTKVLTSTHYQDAVSVPLGAVLGVSIEIVDGNGSTYTGFLSTENLTNGFVVSLTNQPRVYANSGFMTHNLNIAFGSLSSNGQRTISYISDSCLKGTAGSGTTGTATNLELHYRTNGIYNAESSQIEVNLYGLYLYES